MDNQDEKLFGQTPWQTLGPFFHYGLPGKAAPIWSVNRKWARGLICFPPIITC